MKLRSSSQTHNTTLKPEGEKEHETQVIFNKHSHNTPLKPEGEEEHETQVIFTNTRTTLY